MGFCNGYASCRKLPELPFVDWKEEPRRIPSTVRGLVLSILSPLLGNFASSSLRRVGVLTDFVSFREWDGMEFANSVGLGEWSPRLDSALAVCGGYFHLNWDAHFNNLVPTRGERHPSLKPLFLAVFTKLMGHLTQPIAVWYLYAYIDRLSTEQRNRDWLYAQIYNPIARLIS